jgi:glycosyltransferase involved in cell wall biosynthesis
VRLCLIGPTYPYRGGIAHYTTLLAQHLRTENETLLISFERQYPAWLFPGISDRDPSQRPLQTEAEYLLDPLKPLTWRRALRRIREWQPDIVIMQWWHPFWAPAWAFLARGIKRLPLRPRLLFICHNVIPHESRPWDALALRLALAPADGCITHSQADADQLCRLLPQTRVEVSHLPTYASLGQNTPVDLPVQFPQDRPLLLFFGFVRHYKGLDILLEAMPEVLANQSVHLLVVGEFWQSDKPYRAQIRRLNLETAVTLVNTYVPDEELVAYIRAADVVVLPYRSATQSAAVQLAFSLGKPVITTNVGGLSEVVEHGRNGLVVPPENCQELAKAIQEFFGHNLELQFRTNTDDDSRFSWSKLLNSLISLSGTCSETSCDRHVPCKLS